MIDENKGKENYEGDCGLVYVNNPIYDEKKDWIGLDHYIHRLKSAINKNASMIAITSVFGGGKSSLSNLLIGELEKQNIQNEKKSCKFWKNNTKKDIEICTINMWSQINRGDNDHLHKTFLYQLSGCIGKNDGYIGKMLSRNFGLMKIDANFVASQRSKYILFAQISLFFVLHLFFDDWVTTFPDFKLYFQIARYILLLLVLGVGYNVMKKSGVVFSSSKSESSRVLDEIEYYQIYKEIITKSESERIIIIMEDLDRSTNVQSVVNFLSELNKYYITPKIDDKKVTFIFNIKSEAELKADLNNYLRKSYFEKNDTKNSIDEKTLSDIDNTVNEIINYEKIFNYTINLRKINVDDYGVVLKNILEEDKDELDKFCIEYQLNKDDIYKDLNWLIKGSKLNLRILKDRIDDTFTVYRTLVEKQGKEYIQFKKCVISAYLFSEYSDELLQLKDNVFYEIVLKYIQNDINTEEDIDELKNFDVNFKKEIFNLLESHYIDIDYRLYFFNTPKNVPCYKVNELRVINLITYDYDIEKIDEETIAGVKENIIINSLQQRLDFGLKLPNNIYKNDCIFKIILKEFYKDFLSDFTNKIDGSRLKFLDIQNKVLFLLPHLDDISEIMNKYGSGEIITDFRIYLLDNHYDSVSQVKSLFMNGHPMINDEEINLNFDVNLLVDLVNVDSKLYDIKTFLSIANRIEDLMVQNDLVDTNKLNEFFVNSFTALKNKSVILCYIKVCRKLNMIPQPLEDIILEYLNESEVMHKFGELIEDLEIDRIENHTLEFIAENDLRIVSSYEKICLFYDVDIYYYFDSLCRADLLFKIDFKDAQIIEVMKSDFEEILKTNYINQLRLFIVKNVRNIEDYKFVFNQPANMISKEEMEESQDISKTIKLIDYSQITIENSAEIIEAFSSMCKSKEDIFLIHSFVSEIEDRELCEALFFEIDYNIIKFNDLNKNKKQSLINNYILNLDLESNEEKLKFMKATNYLYAKFEEQFTEKELSDDTFVSDYVDLIKKCPNRLTNITIKNIKKFKSLYIFDERIEKQFLSKGLMKYYISSKTRRLDDFEFDNTNENYMKTALSIFLKDGYNVTSAVMAKNILFMEYLLENKYYKGIPYAKFKYFSIFNQSDEMLTCLFNSDYSIENITEYLCIIKGFHLIEGSTYFINRIINEKELLKSDEIFNHTYSMLLNGPLKSKYTIARKGLGK